MICIALLFICLAIYLSAVAFVEIETSIASWQMLGNLAFLHLS